jgi:hypothetical protein
MTIKYKIKEGACLTKCPNGKKSNVLSINCQGCKHFVKIIKEELYKGGEMECNFEEDKCEK